MNRTQVQCFLRTAEEHSFTKAAAALYMSQQSVSRQVALMEEELGTALLDRVAPRPALTPAGQIYYAALSTADRQLNLLQEDLADRRQRLTRRFRIGFSQWLNPWGELRQVLTRFQQAHPGTALELLHLENEDLSERLVSGALDAGFFSDGQAPNRRELKSRRIAKGELRLYAPADVLADGSAGAADCCRDLPMLMVPAWEYSFLERRLIGSQEQAEFGLHPAQLLSLPNLQSLEAALRFGRCTTVGDSRFGVFSSIPGLGSLPLPLEEHLLLVYPAGQQHPLLEDFARTAEEVLRTEE